MASYQEQPQKRAPVETTKTAPADAAPAIVVVGKMTATAMTILLTIMVTMVSMLQTSECWEVHEGGGWKIASNQQNKKKEFFT